jgi:amino acid adenylation domain-containing protein
MDMTTGIHTNQDADSPDAGTAAPPPDSLDDACLPDLLLRQARSRPEDVAVVCGDQRLTFRELAERAVRLAAFLRGRGVGPDDHVGIFVEPSADLVVGAWAILLAGGAYLPLSPEYPEERLRYMIEDSRVGIVLAQEGLARRLTELAPPSTTIITPEDAEAISVAGPPETGLRPHHLAYVIYTSGSTGRPKGVMIEHRSIVSQLRWLNTAHGLGRGRVVLQKTPMSFDAAQWEILAPGLGSTVVMGTPGMYADPRRMIDTIRTYGVTTLQCVPTLLQALLDTEELAACDSLTQIFSGGEALPQALALQCLEALPGSSLTNLYGPTECTINTSSYTLDRASIAEEPQRISIGGPAHGTHYYILDENRSLLPVGEVGELHIGGVQVARGYLYRPELTAEKFIPNPFHADPPTLYRTGDLAYWNPDGTVQFVGRTDNQVKLHGFRVELDEIRVAIENHDWVRNAAVVVRDDGHTGFQNLVAFIELNPKEAALMDQGVNAAHHLSKNDRVQIRAQLSNAGCRESGGGPAIDLPGRTPGEEQWRRVFARKTYRFYEGGPVTGDDVLAALGRRITGAAPRDPAGLSQDELGEILRSFGQFHSEERLLPKYGYASPGSLYATQLYLEVGGTGIAGLPPGVFYYHPVHHRLVPIQAQAGTDPGLRVHFIGKRSAIEAVYKRNVQEVLEFEAGHMVGLFEEILPAYGLGIRPYGYAPETGHALEEHADDHYLGTFELGPWAGAWDDGVEVYVQSHPGKIADLPAGLYRHTGGELRRAGDDLVLKKHVIAINQHVYERASLGISLVSRPEPDWLRYIALGRALHHAQANDVNLGFMSSGYSSRTGDDLPSARRLADLLHPLGEQAAASYFAVGGRVSDDQLASRGMREDLVHMKGPTELIRDDLTNYLPHYMMPNKVVVLDRLPLTTSGKIDAAALRDRELAEDAEGPFVPPRTDAERRIGAIWKTLFKRDTVSVKEDFFQRAGNSLIAMALIERINIEFGSDLPVQVVFSAPTVESLARRVGGDAAASSRLIPLRAEDPDDTGTPVFCWPGLGGYPMNLRLLADRAVTGRPCFGVQAYGVNEGEVPYADIAEMAAADLEAIRQVQPEGPYTLWGYSFGARVAFEAARQLELAGERVREVFLIAPGSPEVGMGSERTYLAILFSVFAGRAEGPLLAECLAQASDEEELVAFVTERIMPDGDLVRRIARVVSQSYGLVPDLAGRPLDAPVTIFRARGDQLSPLESARTADPPAVVTVPADHYGMLKPPIIDRLVSAIRRATLSETPRSDLPRAARSH